MHFIQCETRAKNKILWEAGTLLCVVILAAGYSEKNKMWDFCGSVIEGTTALLLPVPWVPAVALRAGVQRTGCGSVVGGTVRMRSVSSEPPEESLSIPTPHEPEHTDGPMKAFIVLPNGS